MKDRSMLDVLIFEDRLAPYIWEKWEEKSQVKVEK
jgi:hypothetical protein